MSDITKIKIDNEREHSYKDFPVNREFKKRAEDDNPGGSWPSELPLPTAGGYGYTTIEEDETVNHKIDEKYLPEDCRWPSDLPLPTAGGYGYDEILAGINKRDMSNDKVVGTKYLIVDFNDVDQSVIPWLKQNCKADNVNTPGFSYRFHGIIYTTVSSFNIGEYDYKTTTALDESNYNYSIGLPTAKFYVILDRDYLSDEDKEQFPTNGIYFGITSTLSILKSVEAGFIKTYKIDTSKYNYIYPYLLVAANDNSAKIMKLIVKADGTISASEY